MPDQLTNSEMEFIQSVRNGTYPPDQFTHKQHLQLAWLHARSSTPVESVKQVCADIQSYTSKVGAQEKFNLTMTGFLSAVIATRCLAQENQADFESWLNLNDDLNFHALDILKTYYSMHRLNDQYSKQEFVWPDLCEADQELSAILENSFA